MIEAKQLVKSYSSGHIAVDGVSFRIEPGEIMCLYGANGAGKTTTINMFLNFLEPSGGQALVDGVDVAAEPLRAKRRLAFLSENVRLYDNFSALQNLSFFSQLGEGPAPSRDDCLEALSRCGLDPKFHHARVSTFSKGMRQKTALAICRLRKAKALFLDEPLSGLDPSAADAVMEMIRDIAVSGTSVLMSTHELLRTSEFADQVAIMKRGRLMRHFRREQLSGVNLAQVYREAVSDEH